jgi:hypothetical protein
MKPQNVELHIEELILHSFAPKDRHAIGESIQRELQRLLTEQEMFSPLEQDREVAHLDGAAFTMKPGARADTIGRQVAQSIYASLRQNIPTQRKE